MYVVGLNAEKNEVVIGPEAALFGNYLVVDKPHWIVSEPKLLPRLEAKIRYASEETKCDISSVVIPTKAEESLRNYTEGSLGVARDDKGSILVTFAKPQKAITPGQSVVFYFSDEVIGGGVISASRNV